MRSFILIFLICDDFQIGFGNLDAGGQKVLDADDDVRFVRFGGYFAFEAAEVTFDDFDSIANSKVLVIKADAFGGKIHHEDEIFHLLIGNDQHSTSKKVFHIKKRDAVLVGKVASGLLGGMDED